MYTQAVFIDTAAIYGFLNQRDGLHEVCTDILRYLSTHRFRLVSHKWVEYETLSKLKKLGLRYCSAYSAFIIRLEVVVDEVTSEIENEALQMFWGYKDKTWSITDCVSVSVMHSRNLYYAFSADKHFREAGFFPLIEYDQGSPVKTFSSLL